MTRPDVHNQDRKYELNNHTFQTSEHVSDDNKEAINKFCDKCFAQGLSKARVKKYITNFHTLFKMADDDFQIADCDQSDLERLVAKIEQSDYAEATKSDFKSALKKYFYDMEGDSREYPDKVRFINTNRDHTKKELPEPLDREQIDAIIDACYNDRDKAMFTVLYEGGLRSGELMALRIRDVEFVEHGVRLNIRGKTGNRKVLLVESEDRLRTWIDKHPHKDEPDAPLWVKIDPKNIMNHETAEEIELSYNYMRLNLKKMAVKAGIRITTTDSGNETSDIYPYIFRHSRATHLSTKLTEAAMKEYFGWTQGSDMPQVYIHLSGRDIDEEIMRIHGLQRSDDDLEQECPSCGSNCGESDSFCSNCGHALDEEQNLEDLIEQKVHEELTQQQ